MEDIDPRSPRLTTVLLFVYAPVLVSLPILLPVLIIFMLVPGGFIVVLAGLYWALSSLIGVVSLAATGRRRVRRSRIPSATEDVGSVSPLGQPRLEPAGAFASTPVPLELGSRRRDVSAQNVVIARRADGVPQVGPAELAPIRETDDRRHVA